MHGGAKMNDKKIEITVCFDSVSEYDEIVEGLIHHGYGVAISDDIAVDFKKVIVEHLTYLDMGHYSSY